MMKPDCQRAVGARAVPMCSADGVKLRKLSGECQYGLLKKLSKFFMSDLTGEKLGLVGGCHGAICGHKKARTGRANVQN